LRKDVDAIWFAGGGNQAMELLGSLNFETMEKAPKLTLGFSDNSVLINALPHHCGAPAFHAPVFKNLHSMSTDKIQALLSGLQEGEHGIALNDDQILKPGNAEGRLVGGNLSLAQYLPGLLGLDYFDDALLFVEDCHEELSRIDRIFCYLNQVGVFNRISGLILGQFSDLQDSGRPFGKTMQDIITTHTLDYSFPIVQDLDFGHDKNQPFTPFPIGVQTRISKDDKNLIWKI